MFDTCRFRSTALTLSVARANQRWKSALMEVSLNEIARAPICMGSEPQFPCQWLLGCSISPAQRGSCRSGVGHAEIPEKEARASAMKELERQRAGSEDLG